MLEHVLGETLIAEVTSKVEDKFQIPEDRIRKYISDTLKQMQPHRVEVVNQNGETKNIDLAHNKFEQLLKLVECRVPTFIVGPAGSGKTKAAEQVAEALNLKFSAVSVGPQTTQSQIIGYMNAVGKYVATEFRKRFEKGGVFLIDEFDSGSAQVLTCLNAALAGDYCAFPDKMVKKHPDFIVIANGNTWGNGADRTYVGRAQLDGATLDRFAFLEWGYDEKLEEAISGASSNWKKYIKQCRANAESSGIRAIISPRASIYGQRLLDAGVEWDDVVQMFIVKGLPEAEANRVCP